VPAARSRPNTDGLREQNLVDAGPLAHHRRVVVGAERHDRARDAAALVDVADVHQALGAPVVATEPPNRTMVIAQLDERARVGRVQRAHRAQPCVLAGDRVGAVPQPRVARRQLGQLRVEVLEEEA